MWAKYCESLTSLPVYNQPPFSSLVLQYVDAPFFVLLPLGCVWVTKQVHLLPTHSLIFSDSLIFCYLICALFYCLLYRTQPGLLLAPLFHPFQFSIGQFVKPPNLVLYTTNCTAFAWVTRKSLPREIVFWFQLAITTYLVAFFWHLHLICVGNPSSQNSFK